MKNVLMGMLFLIAIGAMTNAAVIPDVTATATDEYVTEFDVWVQGAVCGRAENVVDGSGFEEKLGYHFNSGMIAGNSGSGSVINASTGQIYRSGTMWIASMSPLPSITFDLGAAQTLTAIKVWNGNDTGNITYSGLGDNSTNQAEIDRLNMGVQTMDIVLKDAGESVITTLVDVSLDKAPGLAKVDFGQLLDITDTANVRYVTFNIKSNHGDVLPGGLPGMAALSEVRFYNDLNLEIDAGPDQDVALAYIGPSDPNSVTIYLDGTVTADGLRDTTWSVAGDDELTVTIADVNAVDTTAYVEAAQGDSGLLTFTFVDDATGISDTVKVRVLTSANDRGLIGRWLFDDLVDGGPVNWGATVLDTSGYGHNGSFQPFAEISDVNTLFDKAMLTFSGTMGGGVSIENTDLDLGSEAIQYPYFFDLPSSEMTMSIWCKVEPDDLPADKQLSALFSTSNANLKLLGDAVLGRVSSTLLNKPSLPFCSNNRVMSKTKITDGNWHFVVMTYDGFSLKLYVDTRLESEAFMYDGQQLYRGSNTDVYIGMDSIEYRDIAFPGWTDEARIYRYALDQADIEAAYLESGLPLCPELLEGDLDGDCDVDLVDYAKLASNWLQ